MLPVILSQKSVRVGIAGAGDGLRSRQRLVAQAGFAFPALFESRLPDGEEIARLHLLFVAGLGEEDSRTLATRARERGVLVNVADRPELCDFHVPAVVRRGDLLLTVSTGGKSPALARILRAELEEMFGAEWAGRLAEIAALREKWRGEGIAMDEIAARTEALLAEKQWRARRP